MIQLCSNFKQKSSFLEDSFILSNIMLYLKKKKWLNLKQKKQMSKTQAKKLSFKFVPYLFIAVTILTTFGSNSGTWAWTNSNLMV